MVFSTHASTGIVVNKQAGLTRGMDKWSLA